MLTLRQEQMAAFEQAAIHDFEDRTWAHLQEYFPTHCAMLGREQMLRVIHQGWERSQGYDLTAECCVRSFIELMCLLGGHFDTDPLLPWAAEILDDRGEAQVQRGDRLYFRAWEHIRLLVPDYREPDGTPNTDRFAVELRALRHESDDPVSPMAMPAFSQAVYARIARVFPAKVGVVGAEATRSLIQDAITTAGGYGIRGQRGLILFSVLSFVLGRELHDDPLLPWAAATLTDPGLTEERRKVDRLFAAGVDCLRAWWRSPHPHDRAAKGA
jgi:hypothetical protein